MSTKATAESRYPDKHHSWKSSGSFGRNEIALAIYCLEKGCEHMIEQEKDEEAKETKINSQKRISLYQKLFREDDKAQMLQVTIVNSPA